jgi:glycosyltransferase involved in cell wall biosynthesis
MVDSSSRPPLLLLTHEFSPRRGGIATYAEEMARAAVALGFAVEVWAPEAPAPATASAPVLPKTASSPVPAKTPASGAIATIRSTTFSDRAANPTAAAVPTAATRTTDPLRPTDAGEHADDPRNDLAPPYAVRRLPIRGTHGPRCVLRTARELLRERTRLRGCVVLLAEPGPMLAWMVAGLFAALRPRELLLAFHGSELLRWQTAPLQRRGLRTLLRQATRTATLTGYTEALLLRQFPEATDKVCRTPGAPRTARVLPPRGTTTSDRRSDTGDRRLVVLTVGRLHPRKGQVQTLAALQRLAPGLRARVEYWIAGGQSKGGCEETLRSLAAAGDVPVRFLGEVADEELDRLYAQADLFALTSVEYGHSVEGFGLVYLEAAAHGLPAIAHRVGGVSEAVIDGETGLCVAPNEPDQLTAAFARLLGDADLRRRMGEAARARARLANWTDSARALLLPAEPASLSR